MPDLETVPVSVETVTPVDTSPSQWLIHTYFHTQSHIGADFAEPIHLPEHFFFDSKKRSQRTRRKPTLSCEAAMQGVRRGTKAGR